MSDRGKILFLTHTAPIPQETSQDVLLSQDVPNESNPECDSEALLHELVLCLSDEEQGPLPSLAGYLITGDPTYLPERTGARLVANKAGRDKLLEALILTYLREHIHKDTES